MLLSYIKRIIFISAVLTQPAFADPDRWQRAWPDTDFSQTTIEDWSEILSGGPGKDGIPAIDDPTFVSVQHKKGLLEREPVITVINNGDIRAYPIRYLTWHEIVNDTVGGAAVAITFCPLCNSALVFERDVKGQELSFGVSGNLRFSDMIMYDRETQSWWQQAVGQGIVGEMAGVELVQMPSWMETWQEFKHAYPHAKVMEKPNYNRDYGRNPYVGYDSSTQPFLYFGDNPPHDISPLMRVVRVGQKAWTLDVLSKVGHVDAGDFSITWKAGQASALDAAKISEGRDVGSIRVRDSKGNDIAHDVMFAFAFHAFFPEGEWNY